LQALCRLGDGDSVILDLVDDVATREVQLTASEFGFCLLDVAYDTMESVRGALSLNALMRTVKIVTVYE
jgi:hypothetical protein